MTISNIALFVFRQNGTGFTPFMEAAKQGHEGVFSAFLEHVSFIIGSPKMCFIIN